MKLFVMLWIIKDLRNLGKLEMMSCCICPQKSFRGGIMSSNGFNCNTLLSSKEGKNSRYPIRDCLDVMAPQVCIIYFNQCTKFSWQTCNRPHDLWTLIDTSKSAFIDHFYLSGVFIILLAPSN